MRKFYLAFPKCETVSHKFQRLALSTDKKGILALANEGHHIITAQEITNQLFAARYQLYLPKKEELQAQLDLLLTEEK